MKLFGSLGGRVLVASSVILFAFLVVATPSRAAFVTTNEAGIDAVFSQASFGGSTVDIRFNTAATIVRPDLLSIDTDSELFDLFSDGPNGPYFPGNQLHDPTVNMFFVDSINSCGVINPSIVGCALTPGKDLVVESVFAAGAFGTELNSHELGHNLALPHPAGGGNLMNGTLNGSTFLDAGQVATILASALIQFDGPQRFISITPVLVLGGVVPVPPAGILLVSSLVGLFWMRRRKAQATSTA